MTGIARRLEAARRRWRQEDVATAAGLGGPDGRRAPGDAWGPAPEREQGVGAYIGSMVYGGLDGIITTFAVVSGVAGADLDSRVILVLGVGNLIADGFSMGTGNYLSTRSEREYQDREARRQAAEIERAPDEERRALHALFLQHGYGDEEAERLVEMQTRTRDRWVSALMVLKLGIVRDDTNPIRHAIATFLAFVVAGALPLAVYLVGLVVPIEPDRAFFTAVLLSGLALFGLGAAKVFVTRLSPLRSGLEMLAVGGVAAAVAYGIGAALKNLGV